MAQTLSELVESINLLYLLQLTHLSTPDDFCTCDTLHCIEINARWLPYMPTLIQTINF